MKLSPKIMLSRCNFLYKIREKRISKHSIIDANIWQIITENAENYGQYILKQLHVKFCSLQGIPFFLYI